MSFTFSNWIRWHWHLSKFLVFQRDSQVLPLARLIATELKDRLTLKGLMTIGAPDYSGCRAEDFELLLRCKKNVETSLKSEDETGNLSGPLELSMGMSNDYATAILHGSTSVRVGSSIFGARIYPAKS